MSTKSNQPQKIFQALDIPHREVSKASTLMYRVFSDPKNFVDVEAENAQLALEKSGIKDAYRIESDSILMKDIISLQLVDPPSNNTPPDIAQTPDTAQTAKPVEAKEPEATLSPDDVNKLLENK